MPNMTGSAPSVRTTTEPTIDPSQQALLSALAGRLGGAGQPGSAFNFGQFQPNLNATYSAPLSPLQTSSIAGMENLVNAFTSGPVGAGASRTGLDTATGIAQNPGIPFIDPTAAFNKGVMQPLTDDFTQHVIPSINANYGQSAGGGYSSDALGARNQAGTNLARTLAQTGSQFTLAADQANQNAAAQTAGLKLAAATAIPGLEAAPLQQDLLQQNILAGGEAAGAVPREQQQQQISGQYSDFQSILQQIQQQIADALGLSTAQTQQTQSVVNPGQTGLISALIAALGGGAARGLTGAGGFLGPSISPPTELPPIY